MKRRRYTEEQIVPIPREHEAGASVPGIARHHDVAENTIYRWKSKFGDMQVSEAKWFGNLLPKQKLAPFDLDSTSARHHNRGGLSEHLRVHEWSTSSLICE